MRRLSDRKEIPIIVREAFKRAADLILPFKCPVCGGVSDINERFGNYDRLYTALYGTEHELHICGKCLSMLDASDEDKRWFLCLSNPKNTEFNNSKIRDKIMTTIEERARQLAPLS